MSETFQKKVTSLKKTFSFLTSIEARYSALIEMGRSLLPLSPDLKTPENLVRGCQSHLYLYTKWIDGKIFFNASSDSLISSGLAALLITVYSEEPPEILLTHPPIFLEELNIHTSLSLNRSSGLNHIHLRMKQEALKYLIVVQRS